MAHKKKKEKYFAKTVNERTLTNEDIATLIVERCGTKWKYAEPVEVFILYCRETGIQLCDGYVVRAGNDFSLYPHAKGVFASLGGGVTEKNHPQYIVLLPKKD